MAENSPEGARLDDPAEIGRRVLRLRTERGLTQRQLAEPAYTPAYVSTLESGKVRPSEAALRHLAGRLGVGYEELATGRPARLATDLRLRLTDARRALATGAPEDAAAVFRALHEEAVAHGLVPEQATALQGLGDCLLESGELTDARDCFAAVERLLADEPLPRRVPAIRGRATAHLLTGELRYACYLLETTLDELDAAGLHDPDALLLLYTASIAPYMDMGAHARAAHAAELALALAPRVSDPALVAHMHRGVARTLIAEGRTAEADASLAKAQELYRQLHIRTELAHCHWMRGYVHAQDGDLEGAESELRTARDMLASKRAALFTEQVEVELADVLRRRGKTAEAEALLRPLLTSGADGAGTGPLGAERGAVHAGGAHRLLGLIAEERGDTESAEEHYCAALSLLERSSAAGDLADLCRLLGDLLRRTGRVEAALDAYRTGLGHRAAPGTTTLGPAPATPPL
ncbi:helix-turn-helix domain-containing protein [Streptomyces spectabilis]|uniref:Helix-turn-helix domain-containing protein n=1 Tax=Streptomyces spectabilis TaxID=68270 RepID=A0A5P2X330_STRST|nr:tetratricopeptide repeat protein [Streptomyces spectabilis]MBB5101362.1 tetratricopeptide (TPR) repeat protein [Streptomyces spectabilis]MCI3900558.1 tetratricopeptide repeat protein [Streptomyces spectabilis]QEV58124.1 helix-turn-helix domain-containing protein [Streptomyces spectabilis]GGV10912.1 transcriptional regulator [Streptomyces spectabilis]